MNVSVAADRAAYALNGREALPVWTESGARPQSGGGLAERTPARPRPHRATGGVPLREHAKSRPDAGTGLIRALTDYFSEFGLELQRTSYAPWESITFSGARHDLIFGVDAGACLDRLQQRVASLEDADLSLPGHIVADIVGKLSSDFLLRIEALTVAGD